MVGAMCGWVDFDPVIAHGRPDLLVGGFGDDYVGGLDGHMAVDAVAHDCVTELL